MSNYPQQYGHGGGHVLPAPRNGLGTASLVLGIVGLAMSWMPFIGFIGFVCGLVGIALGVAGIYRVSTRKATNRTAAIIGVVLSALAVLISIVVWTATVNAVDDALGPDAVTPAVSGSSAPAADPRNEFAAGEAADIEGLVIVAGPLKKVTPRFGSAVVCSDVNYVNNSDEDRHYNGGFDWKLQDPNNVIVSTTFAEGSLSAGALAPGGKVAGSVCFTDPKLQGGYAIINDQLGLSSTTVRWTTSL